MKFYAIEREKYTEVLQLEPEVKTIAIFYDNVGMAYDYVEFLNDKYCDKNVNAEWETIDRPARIKHHLEQIELLKNEKRLYYNSHGNEVKK